MDVARKLQREGKVRFIGFSTHGPTDVIVKTIETNQFDYLNLHWYYINQSNWPAIEAAQRHDMGVFYYQSFRQRRSALQPAAKIGRLVLSAESDGV